MLGNDMRKRVLEEFDKLVSISYTVIEYYM